MATTKVGNKGIEVGLVDRKTILVGNNLLTVKRGDWYVIPFGEKSIVVCMPRKVDFKGETYNAGSCREALYELRHATCPKYNLCLNVCFICKKTTFFCPFCEFFYNDNDYFPEGFSAAEYFFVLKEIISKNLGQLFLNGAINNNGVHLEIKAITERVGGKRFM